jgi:polysaccharide pyruvyl transferase WcaK-like protein
MAMPPIRIGLFGLFGVGNFGNEGSLEAMVTFVRNVRPDAQLTCICGYPRKAQRDHQISAIPIRLPGPTNVWFRVLDRLFLRTPRVWDLWTRTIKQVRTFDVLIIPGTGILGDFGGPPWASPFAMPLSLLLWCAAAKFCGTRVCFVSVGAGPIHSRIGRWFVRSAVRLASYRSYRDQASRAFMKSIGLALDDGVFPDLVFGQPAMPAVNRPHAEPLRVGVGIMEYRGWNSDSEDIYEAYINKVADFIIFLVRRGHRVQILIGQASDHWAVGDLLTRIRITEPGLSEGVIAAEQASSLDDVMRQINKTDLVVATRFHNVVCALKLGKPTISISYAGKNDELLASMGLGEFCQPIELLEVDRLIDQFTRIAADREKYARGVREAVAQCFDRLRQQQSTLCANYLTKAGRDPTIGR